MTAGAYQIAGTAYVYPLTAFTLSSGVCTTVTYTLTTSTGAAIDSAVFTFSSSAMTVTVSTTDKTKIATYSFILTGVITGDTTSATSTFSIVINSQCYG